MFLMSFYVNGQSWHSNLEILISNYYLNIGWIGFNLPNTKVQCQMSIGYWYIITLLLQGPKCGKGLSKHGNPFSSVCNIVPET